MQVKTFSARVFTKQLNIPWKSRYQNPCAGPPGCRFQEAARVLGAGMLGAKAARGRLRQCHAWKGPRWARCLTARQLGLLEGGGDES
jgi:hypothetical protein